MICDDIVLLIKSYAPSETFVKVILPKAAQTIKMVADCLVSGNDSKKQEILAHLIDSNKLKSILSLYNTYLLQKADSLDSLELVC